MTITVIGHVCLDVVEKPDGGAQDQFGGIVYAVAALAGLVDPSDTVIPVFGVGEADYDRLLEFLGRFPNVATKGIYRFSEPTNRVRLFYVEDGSRRIECSHHISQPIPFQRIKPHLNSDGVLVNMISGNDIALATLDAIRMETRDRGVPIHLDLHSVTLGVDEHHKRFRRPLTDWRRWCFMLSSVQLSEEEAAGLSSERYTENELISQMMPLMVGALLVTRGPRGATLIRQEHKKLHRHDLPPLRLEKAVDPTGCGDVFGAAYLWKFLESRNPLDAATFANAAAAYKATVAGPQALDSLRRHAGELLKGRS